MFTLTFTRLLPGLGFWSESASVRTDVGLAQTAASFPTSGTAGNAPGVLYLVVVRPGAKQSCSWFAHICFNLACR